MTIPPDDPEPTAVRATLYASVKAAPGDDIAAVTAAIRNADRSAQVTVLAPGNVLAIETAADADAIRDAIHAAGYVTSISARRPRGKRTFSVKRLIGQSLLWFAAGTLGLPFATLILMLVIVSFDPVCGTPGDSGGCEMGAFATILSAVPLGAALGFAINVYRGLR